MFLQSCIIILVWHLLLCEQYPVTYVLGRNSCVKHAGFPFRPSCSKDGKHYLTNAYPVVRWVSTNTNCNISAYYPLYSDFHGRYYYPLFEYPGLLAIRSLKLEHFSSNKSWMYSEWHHLIHMQNLGRKLTLHFQEQIVFSNTELTFHVFLQLSPLKVC